ncbi:hypothetical protein RXV95_10620 [Novosphingobium sp. ZN18A2]|uniref:hypothetical protein n=1 Tax=Novosphingobium sp. ZN18A2 TaxID=3079861 RepID=UPI0030CE769E
MKAARFLSLAIAATTAGTAFIPASAQTAVDPDNVTARDVVLKPFTDFNLEKDPVPDILQTAVAKPYDLTGLRECSAMSNEVRDLDTVLGDDIDAVQEKSRGEKRGNAIGGAAQSVVGSLIPFGGLIREISGANENRRRWNVALYAGSVRRAFLKGIGQQRGCAYPARSADHATPEQVEAERLRIDEARKNGKEDD